jgi:hypothetical protein
MKGGDDVECEGPASGITLALWQLRLVPSEFDELTSLARSLTDMALPHASISVVYVV